MEKTIGAMKVVYIRNSKTTEHDVENLEKAKEFIDFNAKKDLKDESVDYNSFSLLVYDPSNENSYTEGKYKGWYEWRDDDNLDINGYMI